MSTVLSVQSQVCAGHVGTSMAGFVLQRMGLDVIAVPSAVLSNHTGLPGVADIPVHAEDLAAMVEALRANGLLDDVAAMLTGYLTPAAIPAVLDLAPHVPCWICDPVMGDVGPGTYVSDEVVAAMVEQLAPRARVLTPNLHELGLLTGTRPASLAGVWEAVSLLPASATVLVTSCLVDDLPDDSIAMVLSSPEGRWLATTPHLRRRFDGSGDLTAAVLTGLLLDGVAGPDLLARTAATVHAVLAATGSDHGEPDVVAAQDELVAGHTVPVTAL